MLEYTPQSSSSVRGLQGHTVSNGCMREGLREGVWVRGGVEGGCG